MCLSIFHNVLRYTQRHSDGEENSDYPSTPQSLPPRPSILFRALRSVSPAWRWEQQASRPDSYLYFSLPHLHKAIFFLFPELILFSFLPTFVSIATFLEILHKTFSQTQHTLLRLHHQMPIGVPQKKKRKCILGQMSLGNLVLNKSPYFRAQSQNLS